MSVQAAQLSARQSRCVARRLSGAPALGDFETLGQRNGGIGTAENVHNKGSGQTMATV